MRKSRLRILVGITFSSLLIGQVGVVSVYGSEDFSLIEVGEEKWDYSIWNDKGFRIQSNVLTSFNAEYVKLEEDKYDIKIPNNVIEIGQGAFSGDNSINEEGRKIKTVSIPRNINAIGARCFKDCAELTTVTFSHTLPYDESNYQDLNLGYAAFAGCTSLKSIDLSDLDRVKNVEASLFEGCTSLQSVILSSGMTQIPNNMFKDCSSLKYLEIPDNITSISNSAFDGTSDLTLYCKSGTEAAKAIEEYNKISDLKIPVKYVNSSSYEKEKQIIDIQLEDSITMENGRIVCYLDDKVFNLNATTTGNGMITYLSENKNIFSVDSDGLVTIHGTGNSWIYIDAAETYFFARGYRNIPITVKEREQDPVNPPVDDPNNPDNPSNPTNPDNPGNPDSGTTPGGGDSNQYTGNENTDSSQSKEQKIEVKKIEVTYGDSPFTIQPGKDMGTKVSFSSSNKKVFTVSSKGKITIKGCGSAKLKMKSKTAAKTFEIVVKPKKNSITSLETKKRNITVKWPRDKKADGYYIYYSTDSKFKKSVKKVQIPKNKTVQYTIKKLKSGKKYYVRLYSYKKSGKNVILSDASKTKNIKVK